MALQGFSFKTEDIEEAMNNTILYGGDLHSALDWLCLNLSDGNDKGSFMNFEKSNINKAFYKPSDQI